MSDKAMIFISHSHKDKLLANTLKDSLLNKWLLFSSDLKGAAGGSIFNYKSTELPGIEVNVDKIKLEIFVSSGSDAIPTGVRWQEHVLDNLRQSDIFVPILTPNSINSNWVWFEIGFFWSKTNGNNLFPAHSQVTIPSPLNTLQSKDLGIFDELSAWHNDILYKLFIAYAQKLQSKV